MLLVVEQFLNGLQFGLLLFLLAAGLTLVFGIMDFVNLAHGSLYMMGAYFAATFVAWTGSFVLGALLALGATLLLGIVLEFVALRHLYGRDHLDHVLATFGLILFFNDAVRLIWGPAGLALPLPAWLTVPLQIMPGVYYPAYRLAIIVVALVVGAAALSRGDADPDRHADPRRRLQPRDDRRARHQHQAALHPGVRARRCAGRSRRADAGADPHRADRHGREHPDPRLRHHRHRRHRLDPRRVPRRDLRRHDRHAGPRLPARPAAAGPEFDRRRHRGARAVLDADLSADGDRAGGAAGGAVSGRPSDERLPQRPQRRRRAGGRWPAAAAGLYRAQRQHLLADAVHPHRHLRAGGGQPQPHHGLWRHDELRPRRLSRHRRLCGRHSRP